MQNVKVTQMPGTGAWCWRAIRGYRAEAKKRELPDNPLTSATRLQGWAPKILARLHLGPMCDADKSEDLHRTSGDPPVPQPERLSASIILDKHHRVDDAHVVDR